MRGATGPNVSSLHTNMSVLTSVRMVGSKNVCPSGWRCPPRSSLAPFERASATCLSTWKRMRFFWKIRYLSSLSTPECQPHAWMQNCNSIAVRQKYTPILRKTLTTGDLKWMIWDQDELWETEGLSLLHCEIHSFDRPQAWNHAWCSNEIWRRLLLQHNLFVREQEVEDPSGPPVNFICSTPP